MSCLAVAAAAPALAHAQESPPISAVDVYVEMIPTSAGDVPAEPSAQPEGIASAPPVPLPGPAATELREGGGPDAPLLERIATEPRLGAPRRVDPPESEKPGADDMAIALSDYAPPLAGGESRVLWLVVALAGITALVAVAAFGRRVTPRGRLSDRRATRRTR